MMRRNFRRVRTTFLVLIVAFLILPANSFAQKKQWRPDSTVTAVIVDTLSAQIALSDSQKAKLHKIIFGSINEIIDAHEKYGKDREIFTFMQNNINDRRDRAIEGILNKEQRKDYELVKDKIAKMHRNFRKKAKRGKKGKKGTNE